ncbi:uncharacterized protein RHOBADRAFT_66350, partial [Rhodotorula graminis WP1]
PPSSTAPGALSLLLQLLSRPPHLDPTCTLSSQPRPAQNEQQHHHQPSRSQHRASRLRERPLQPDHAAVGASLGPTRDPCFAGCVDHARRRRHHAADEFQGPGQRLQQEVCRQDLRQGTRGGSRAVAAGGSRQGAGCHRRRDCQGAKRLSERASRRSRRSRLCPIQSSSVQL